jgi:AcrR family transcriptional regulator
VEKERKLQIIKAADKRFSKHGLGKTTLDEIARDLRIGKATIYHYFISKEELFFETINWEVTQIVDDIKSIFNNDQKTLKERLLEYFYFKENIISKYKLVYEITLLLLKEEEYEKENEIISGLIKQEHEILSNVLESLNKNGSSKPGFPLVLISLSWGGMYSNKLILLNGIDKTPGTKELFTKALDDYFSEELK